MSIHPRYRDAARVISDSCRVARGVQRRLDDVRAITKDDRSPVTVADFAVQAIVSLDLHEAGDDLPIVGEERADVLRQPDQAAVLQAVVEAVQVARPGAEAVDVLAAIDRCDHDATAPAYWTLDPVDGTKGFLRGQQYAIALGLIEDGEVTFGMMGCPNLGAAVDAPVDAADPRGLICAAASGTGAWAIPADEPAAAPQAMVATSFQAGAGADQPIRICESVEAAHSKHGDVVRIAETVGRARVPVRLDSQCKYAIVARGQADAYLRMPTKKGYVEKIWDHAAGSLIAIEAGAIVSDITGAPLDFGRGPRLEANRGVVCAADGLHAEVIEAIDRLGIGAAV